MATPPGLIAGVVGGGVLGAMHRKGLGLDAAARERLGRDLEGGKAAVGVLAVAERTTAVTQILEDLGGGPRSMKSATRRLPRRYSVGDQATTETTEGEAPRPV